MKHFSYTNFIRESKEIINKQKKNYKAKSPFWISEFFIEELNYSFFSIFSVYNSMLNDFIEKYSNNSSGDIVNCLLYTINCILFLVEMWITKCKKSIIQNNEVELNSNTASFLILIEFNKRKVELKENLEKCKVKFKKLKLYYNLILKYLFLIQKK